MMHRYTTRRQAINLGLITLSSATTIAVRAATPHRIVSVGGALTEIIYALQAQAELVGVDTTSSYPAPAQLLPSVGYARTLSAEGLLALTPTLVMVTEDAGPVPVLRQVAKAGISVETLAANHQVEGLMDRINRVGELTSRVPQAKALQLMIRQEWAQVQTKIDKSRSKPARVLFVLAHTPNQIMVAGRGTSAQAMLNYAGASNAMQGFSGYKPLTPEAVIAAQPDLILLTDQGLRAAGGVDGILKLPGLAQTGAGRARRVVSMDALFLLGFGPRLPQAVAGLHSAIDSVYAV